MIIQFLFWLSLLLLIYTYFIYPAILALWAKWKTDNQIVYALTDNLPTVTVVISVYNEATVIEKRIRNIFETTYPQGKIEVLTGSDGSTDDTNLILNRLQTEFSALHIFTFTQRQGKANVINQLVPCAKGELLIFTDAKVTFTQDTVFQLVKHFKNNAIGCVGANIINKNELEGSVLHPEKTYMSREMTNKYYEGKIWGTTIGVYGACYAIPRNYFTAFPYNFSVEDFYISMQIMQRKKKCILDIHASCFENVPNSLMEEFRRKIRISVGNFQNLFAFKKLIFKFSGLSFCFISHKIIRWFGPFLLIMLFISNIFLAKIHPLYLYSIYFQLFILIIPLIDFFLHIIRREVLILRYISHFYTMNLALIIGCIKFLKGAKTNVWEPTNRE